MTSTHLKLIAAAAFAVATLCSAQPPGEPVSIATSYTIDSRLLEETRRVNVYLPPDYGESKEAFPVLYLLDGGASEDLLHIAGIASLAADYRKIRPFIVVGIEGIDRYHDFSHPTTVESEIEELPNHGGSSDFRAFLGGELRPWVAKHFRITDESVLIGESFAGLLVTETFLRQPSLFGGYIAVSPSLWWDDESLSKNATELLAVDDFPRDRRFYLTIADEGRGMKSGIERLAAAIEAADVPVDLSFRPMPGETHGTTFHPAALDAIRLFFSTPEDD